MRCSLRMLHPISINIHPPIISARFPIFVPHFFPNSIPRNERKKVITPIKSAGIHIFDILAVSDTPTASASILVAIERMKTDFHPKVFLELCMFISEPFHPEEAILPPIYVRRIKAIQ